MSDTNSICERCGFIGSPMKKTPGSTGAQVTLFILGFITFGIVLVVWAAYVIWRIVKTEEVCPSCQAAKTMVALDSPLGRTLQDRFAAGGSVAATPPPPLPASAAEATKRCPYCAETIKAEARLCRYCGKDLEPAAMAAEPARAAGQRGAASPLLVAVLCIAAVVAVFVVRAVFVASEVNDQLAEAKVHAAKIDLHTLENCLDLYKYDKGKYPTSDQGLKAIADAGKCKPQLEDPWGHPYVYRYPGKVHPESFDLMSYGADGQPGGEGLNADIVNQ